MKKAARKREWPPRNQPLFDPDSSDEDTSSPEVSDDDDDVDDDDDDQVDQLDSDDDRPMTDEDVLIEEMPELSITAYKPPTIKLLPTPPRKYKTLAETPPQVLGYPQNQPPRPSDELIAALERLSLSSVLMQRNRQLPFMLRNLRRGFLQRCITLGVSTKPSSGPISVTVHYAYSSETGDQSFDSYMEEWVCPLCELYGAFRTRDMLVCHLDWDHDEASVLWEYIEAVRGCIHVDLPQTPHRLITGYLDSPNYCF